MPEIERQLVSLYTDEHVTGRLAADVRMRGYQSLGAIEAGHIGWNDDDHLAYAVEHEMALGTFDMRMVEAVEHRTESGLDFWGVILAPQFSNRQYGTLLAWTLDLLDRVTAVELRNAVVFLQQFHG